MTRNREFNLRFSISLVFAIVIFLPLFFISADLGNISVRLWQQQLATAQQDLKEELADFRNSLIPRQFIENLIKRAENRLGLVSTTMHHPVFPHNQEAGIFTVATIGQLREFYRNEADIQPLVLVTFNTDYSDVWIWFNQNYAEIRNLSAYDHKRFETLVPFMVADTATFSTVIANNHKARAALENFRRELQLTGKRDSTYHKFFYDYVGDLSYRPPHYGIVYEMATNRLESRRFFVYSMPVKAGELVYGGYFVIFASRDVTPDKILKLAAKPTRPRTKRYFSASAKSPGHISHASLSLQQPFPNEFSAYSNLAGYRKKLPQAIGVELSIAEMQQDRAARQNYLAFSCRFIIIVTLALVVYFLLFGFPTSFRLRLRMLAILVIAVCLPMAVLGYFCLSLFDSFQNLAGHELRAEATSSMYRIISYYYDQKLQQNLEILKTKQRMLEHVTRPADELDQMNSHKIVTPENYLELFLFRDDGMTRTFRSRHPTSTNSRRIDCYLAVRYLDNLGVLDRSISANRKYLEHGDYAAGFMYSYYLTYSEHQMMHRECVETREWKKADELSRMAYMLLPDTSIPDAPLRAIGKTTIHTSNLTLIRPYLFAPEVYSQRTAWQKHDFLIGQRRLDDTILRWWPDYINSSSELKHQLDLAAGSRSGGSRLIQTGREFRFVNRRYLDGESMVFAGISTAAPDLRLELLFWVFPFVLLVLVLLCVFLFADLLAALFIKPVSGFQKATAQITGGNYQVNVQMPDSDEFSKLASSFNRMANGLVQREKMRRFVSENLFERIGLSEGESTRTSEVTLLASDIRGFTTLSEKHEPQQIVSLLNDYFTEMETAIEESGGFIERFIGDAVVAVFYHNETGRAENRALKAAVSMRARLVALNQRRAVAGLFVVDNGIGIASGEAVSGVAGSSEGRQIFSVLGEVTRVAEKLESASRHVPSHILICPKTASALANTQGLTDVTDLCGITAFTLMDGRSTDG
ncbi:MAG: hypothetical protein GQF41_3186 [Candidatus Rifleibacterium amylolyticum]|nr:MAG: hypothetical protein GQF41_3186 [Candidatus Rifleibacterium amylolyticum]